MKLIESAMVLTLALVACNGPEEVREQAAIDPPPEVASFSLEELVDLYEAALGGVYRRFGHERGIARGGLTIPPRLTDVPREHVPPEYAHLPISEAFQVLVERWDLPQDMSPDRPGLHHMSHPYLRSDGLYFVIYSPAHTGGGRPPDVIQRVFLEWTPDGKWRVTDGDR